MNADEYMEQYDAHQPPSLEDQYPIGTEIGVLKPSWSAQLETWQQDELAYSGVVVGFTTTFVDDGTPESGPSEPYEMDAVLVRSDGDGVVHTVTADLVTDERCPDCGAYTTRRTVSTGIELSGLTECSAGCGWADLAG